MPLDPNEQQQQQEAAGAAAAAASRAAAAASGGGGGGALPGASERSGRGGAGPPAAAKPAFVFDGTFRGWSYSARPDVRLADLTAVDFLGEGHFGQVKCVAWEPKPSPSSDAGGQKEPPGGGGVPGVPGVPGARRGLFALKILERERFENKVVASGRSEEYYIFNEREIMIEVDSPFHVKLINTYKSAKNLYMLMEYAPGRSLKDQVDRQHGLSDEFLAVESGDVSWRGAGPRPMSRVKFYAANLVLALKHLHARQIVHRDIKPSNVLIDEQGYLKVCDYGFARWLPVGGRTASIAGTYNYLTPEQCLDRDYDHSVDLWCLGITVFNMTYGCTPFEAVEGTLDWQRVTMDNIQHKPIRFLDNRKELPLAGKLLIKSLLQREEAERFGKDLNYDAICSHAWFADVDWDGIERRTVAAPWLPNLEGHP
jgi:serine/threonine protein kinase